MKSTPTAFAMDLNGFLSYFFVRLSLLLCLILGRATKMRPSGCVKHTVKLEMRIPSEQSREPGSEELTKGIMGCFLTRPAKMPWLVYRRWTRIYAFRKPYKAGRVCLDSPPAICVLFVNPVFGWCQLVSTRWIRTPDGTLPWRSNRHGPTIRRFGHFDGQCLLCC